MEQGASGVVAGPIGSPIENQVTDVVKRLLVGINDESIRGWSKQRSSRADRKSDQNQSY